MFDSGGGSTQFTFGRGATVDERFSLDVGAVRIAERFGLIDAVSVEMIDDALEALRELLAPLSSRGVPDAVIAMGGTVTNLAAVKHGLAEYDPDVVNGTRLDITEIDRQIEEYRSRDAEARRAIVGLQPNRAEVILGGACIVARDPRSVAGVVVDCERSRRATRRVRRPFHIDVRRAVSRRCRRPGRAARRPRVRPSTGAGRRCGRPRIRRL